MPPASRPRKKGKRSTPCLDIDIHSTTSNSSIVNGVLKKKVSSSMPPRPTYQAPRTTPGQRMTAGQRIKLWAKSQSEYLKAMSDSQYLSRLREKGCDSPGQMRELEKSKLNQRRATKIVAERRGLSKDIIDLTADKPELEFVPVAPTDDDDGVVSDSDGEDSVVQVRPAKVARPNASRPEQASSTKLVGLPIGSIAFAPPDRIALLAKSLRTEPDEKQLECLGKASPARRAPHRSDRSVFDNATKDTPPRKPPAKNAGPVRPVATDTTLRRKLGEKRAAHSSTTSVELPTEPINLDSDDEVTIVETSVEEKPVARKRERPRPRAENDALPRFHDARFRELDDLENAEVMSVTRGVRRNQELMHIKQAGITLRGQDLACLRGSRWLNDEIMNSFAALINARNAGATGAGAELVEVSEDSLTAGPGENGEPGYERLFRQARPRTHVFNTFFFTRLSQHGYDYSGVRRWLKRAKKDVAELDLILFPINLGNLHWVLGAVDLRNQQFLYLDSFLSSDECGAMPMLRRWLHDEVCDKHGAAMAEAMGILQWPLYENPAYTARQTDGGSCGIFTLYAADFLERGVRPDFRQEDVPLLRRRTVLFLKDGALPE